MQGLNLVTGFEALRTGSIEPLVIPVGAIALIIMALVGFVYWRHLIQHWVSGVIAIIAAASAFGVVSGIWGLFHS